MPTAPPTAPPGALTRHLKATGHPVSGGKPKPTYLTSEPLLAGRLHVLELKVGTKKKELRVGVVRRPEYLRICGEEGCMRSFYSDKCKDAVAFCVMWGSAAALNFGDEQKEKLAGISVSAGDMLRVELDRSEPFKAPRMRIAVNGNQVGKISLPAGWDDLCFGVQLFDHADELLLTAEPEPFMEDVAMDVASGGRHVKATGHPVSGGKPKPTYLTSEPLLAGRLHVLELKVGTKKKELRVGVVRRPEYLRICGEEGCMRSFYSDKCKDAVAFCVMWGSAAALNFGDEQKEKLAGISVSAGDMLRVELDRSEPFKAPRMRIAVNGNQVGKISLPAGWDDLCFGVQLFDHADELLLTAEPEPFMEDIAMKWVAASQPTPFTPTAMDADSATPLTGFPGGLLTLPHYWTALGASPTRASYQTFTLSTASSEYAEVMALFAATATASSYDIVSVRLVCDPSCFLLYQAKRLSFESSLGASKVNERWLWHGTAESTVVLILTNGFLRDFSSTAVYGDGTYFARDASYSLSASYAQPNRSGEQTLFLTRVLLGEPCRGNSGMKTPATKPDGTTMHESLVNSLSSPSIFVLSAGSDQQAYPEFIVKVKKK